MTSLKGRILCTEDDEDTRELFILSLSLSGYEVICTDNPDTTLKLIRTEKFDLCLLDNWMPGVSGEDLCRKIREFDSRTPILFCSGAAYQTDKDRAMAAGAQGYLVKPVLEADLVGEVERIIAASKVAESSARVPRADSQTMIPGE